VGKFESIDNDLTTSRDDGMFGFDESVGQLLDEGRISRTVAEQNMRDGALMNR
jgi:Tfp pilus assembly pilus retraction ATPase PilT